MRLPRALSRRVVVLSVLSAFTVGCDSAAIVPPPDVPRGASTAAESAYKTIDLILENNELADHDLVAQESRQRASFHKVMLDVASLAPGDPPAKQVKLIRAALAHRTAALVIRPLDASEVAEALKDAQAQRIPIVLLDRDVPGLSDASPVTLVTYAPFAKSAAQLVAAVKAAAARDKLRADGVAVLMVNTLADAHSDDRAAALRKAIGDAGLTLAETLQFSGISQHAQPPLLAKLEADPRVTMVFADEDRGMASVHHTARLLIEKRRFTVAGYLDFAKKTARLIRAETTAVADRDQHGFADQAIDAAVRLANGERVPSRIEIAHPVDLGTRAPSPLVE